jgi:short subunit dehydrogenase-like uncharacterized protein
MSMREIWVLGATGQAGAGIAAELARRGAQPVLVGRDLERLERLAATLGGEVRCLVSDSLDDTASRVRAERPAVVVNTVGPFTVTGPAMARACLGGTDYVDLANELDAVEALLALDEEAVASGDSLVTGAGFGVVATEIVALALCEDRPAPASIRVDAIPAVSGLGPAVLASAVDVLGSGARRIENGQVAAARLGSDALVLDLPDGSRVTTIGVPTGELISAWRASGATSVVAATSEVPSGRVARAFLPVAARVLGRPGVRDAVKRAAARFSFTPPARIGDVSWARAEARWPDGTVEERWLRTDEGYAMTSRVACDVALRLAAGDRRPGAHTPGALFGASLAESVGARILVNGA